MEITKTKLEGLIRELPEKVDVEDVMYRIHLLQKIEAGEADIKEERIFKYLKKCKALHKRNLTYL